MKPDSYVTSHASVVTVHLVKTNHPQYNFGNLAQGPPTSTSTTASTDPIQMLALGMDIGYLSRRDPPTAPDGHYDWQVSEDDGTTKNGHSLITNLIEEATTLKGKGVFVPNAKEVVCCSLSGRLNDDRPNFDLKQGGFLDLALNPEKVDDRKDAVSHFIPFSALQSFF